MIYLVIVLTLLVVILGLRLWDSIQSVEFFVDKYFKENMKWVQERDRSFGLQLKLAELEDELNNLRAERK